ncbi:hypothetical protein [Nocardia cyriacigeorgica]|uniref:hypothetical protein n=1 Tax=Nocardia cyriacigeorgica TaxID=135487 RepID=UPI00189485ED|nr:hypothetical protein [Nocardia cyriacigeorgica]MBF6452642.1 hypothetical protein [Nocardia cyriacigeorgica]MBF6477940.1 hypothetical protein [Nocardia cyriacigeorgica]MBF6549811.1 hypothetical protein [Nocardia cyriacigeorgica]
MPPPFRSIEQVQHYLEQIFGPDRDYRIGPIEHGWLCSPQPGPHITFSQTIGMTSLVVNTETGVVHQYPSWPGPKITEDYAEAMRTGRSPAGGQVHPPLMRVSLQRITENADRIEYLVTELPRRRPPHEFRLVIEKGALGYQPTETTATAVTSWLVDRLNQHGFWPESGRILVSEAAAGEIGGP